MNRSRLIIGSIFVVFFVFLLIYDGDNEYLQEKSADKTWYEFLDTVNDVVKKGDHITYNTKSTVPVDAKWKKYSDRFAYQTEVLNIKNAPVMRNSYMLDTSFEETEGKHSVNFTISEKNTGDLVEKRSMTNEPIKAKSVIPALLALVLIFLTLSPVLSLFVAVWIGSIINNGNSILVGLQQVIANYVPSGFMGKDLVNLKIIIFFMFTHITLGLLSYSATGKNLRDMRSKFLKFLPLPFMSFHPYLLASMGTWWINSITTKPKSAYRNAFISQSMSLVLPTFLIFSPYLIFVLLTINTQLHIMNIHIGLSDLFFQVTQFRFFSISMLAIVVNYLIFNKEYGTISNELVNRSLFTKFKSLLKVNRWLPFAAAIIFIGVLCVISLLTLLNYVEEADINTILMISSIASFVFVFIVVIKTYLLSPKEVLRVSAAALQGSFKFLALLVLAFALCKILIDLGMIYYIISLFKVKIGSSLFPLVAFIMSCLITILLGNSLLSLTFILPILLPIAAQLGGNWELMLTIAAILDGGLVGELMSPFSPTIIITTSIGKISSAKQVLAQIPYVALGVVSASILGFLMAGTDIPLWISYGAILTFSLAIMFKKPTYKIMS